MPRTESSYLLRLTHYNPVYGNQIWSKLMLCCHLFPKEFYQHNNTKPYRNKCRVDL